MTISIAEIMTTDVISLPPSNTLKDAHQITRKMGIRHLPIVDEESKELMGIVTQKAMISRVVSLLTQFGNDELEKHEAKTNVMELAVTEYNSVKPEESVARVASFFLENKHGCLPVIDSEKQLVGIVTSSDFVKLAVTLLNEKESDR